MFFSSMVVGGKGKGKAGGGKQKGGQKQFTNVEELKRQQAEISNIRHARKDETSSEDEGRNIGINKNELSDSDDDATPIIEVNNPNRVQQKNIKLTDLSSGAGQKVELSRRERF